MTWCKQRLLPKEKKIMSKKPRWVWIAASVALFAWAPNAAAQSVKFQIEETTIAAVHRAMLAHELSCVELVQQYLSRIEQHNKVLRAIIHVNPNALEIARKLDASLASSGTLSGALHCVPVAVKDAIDTAEMPTSGGSTIRLPTPPSWPSCVQPVRSFSPSPISMNLVTAVPGSAPSAGRRATRTTPHASLAAPAAAPASPSRLISLWLRCRKKLVFPFATRRRTTTLSVSRRRRDW